MEEHECDFPETCPVCNARLQQRDADKEWGRPFLAKYDGQCPGCNLPIRAGVDRCVGDGRRYYHEGCEA